MSSSVSNVVLILRSFFPAALPLSKALGVLSTLAGILPLLKLHRNQRLQPRQHKLTGWLSSIRTLLAKGFGDGNDPEIAILIPYQEGGKSPEEVLAGNLVDDIEVLYEFLGLDHPEQPNDASDGLGQLYKAPPQILVTTRLNCAVCPTDEIHALRRHVKHLSIRLLDSDFIWKTGLLFVAKCAACKADYYPDRYTFIEDDERKQRLEFEPTYFRVSKSGVWMHKSIAVAQEKALYRFHCGWSNFAGWLNDTLKCSPAVTARQSQRLFLEYFSRRLLFAHGKHHDFSCSVNPNSSDLAECVRAVIGKDGGVIPTSLHHGCTECTHKKRYRADLIAEGAILNSAENTGVAGIHGDGDGEEIEPPNPEQIDEGGPTVPPVQEELHREEGTPRGYVRMAVMDGKTITHRICALDACNNPLVNYKNGRFCEDHLNLIGICGIIPCGRPVAGGNSVVCDDPEHLAWHRKYLQRFTRLSYPGVRRVIRRQQAALDDPNGPRPAAPTLRVQDQLPNLQDLPGGQVVHTFRAKSTYCLQTIQWACGIPVGWGKCYRSESSPQVLAILDKIWQDNDELRPSFIAYDDACGLLRHIVTQNANSHWLKSTKFVVDAWHYIGHRSTDVLCRIWCNPAPTNGSQPDLILTQTSDDGEIHTVRAFNTETAEHLNSWLDGFDSQLRQMSAVNYDFFVHVLMLIYKESVEERIIKKGLDLTEEFWEED